VYKHDCVILRDDETRFVLVKAVAYPFENLLHYPRHEQNLAELAAAGYRRSIDRRIRIVGHFRTFVGTFPNCRAAKIAEEEPVRIDLIVLAAQLDQLLAIVVENLFVTSYNQPAQRLSLSSN
jgi:hypothetical protein